MTGDKKESVGIKVGAWAIMLALFPAIAAMIDGLATFGKQALVWFKTGTWTPQTLWEALHHWGVASRPATGWYVPDGIINYLLDGPRSFWMVALALVYMVALAAVVIALGFGLERIAKLFKRQSPAA